MDETTGETPNDNPSSDKIKDILARSRVIAVVGLSPKKDRDSNKVAAYLIDQGYEIIPVNPGQREILSRKCYRSLNDIPFHVDLADLFLNPSRVPPVVDQAILKAVDVIWMQQGIVHNESAEKARGAGIQVVMDRCIKVEHEKLLGEFATSGKAAQVK